MNRFELLAMSSCLPLKANRYYEYKYHLVCPFHVIAPYLFKSYFPGMILVCFSYIDSSYPWLPFVTEDNVIVTAEFRDVILILHSFMYRNMEMLQTVLVSIIR